MRFSIDCGSGTGGKDLVGFRIIGNWPPGSAADAPADQRIKIPGAVDEIRVIHLDHLTADRKISGDRSMAWRSASVKCGSTVVSLFKRMTYGVCACRMPALTAALNP